MEIKYLESLLLESRIIFISGEINEALANYAIAGLLLLDAQSQEKPINLYINCYGGGAYEGLAIYDVMRLVKAPVDTYCVGKACSMAAWLLAAGKKGKRFATSNSYIMIHQGRAGMVGTTEDVRVEAEHTIDLQERMIKILAKHTGQSEERVCDDIRHNLWLNPEQAKDYGIIDEILEV